MQYNQLPIYILSYNAIKLKYVVARKELGDKASNMEVENTKWRSFEKKFSVPCLHHQSPHPVRPEKVLILSPRFPCPSYVTCSMNNGNK